MRKTKKIWVLLLTISLMTATPASVFSQAAIENPEQAAITNEPETDTTKATECFETDATLRDGPLSYLVDEMIPALENPKANHSDADSHGNFTDSSIPGTDSGTANVPERLDLLAASHASASLTDTATPPRDPSGDPVLRPVVYDRYIIQSLWKC